MLFALSFKLLWRELKSGQLTVMFAAIVLSVTSVSCISIFSDRLQQALFLETREFLGGDLKYDSNEELNEKELEGINNNEINSTLITSFASMLSSKNRMQLSSIKAVDNSYPLLGQLTLEEATIKNDQINLNPKKGFVFIDKRLQQLLEIEIGDTVEIGNTELTVSNILLAEPDRASSSFAFAPKAIMNVADLPATNIIQPGSRVRYEYLFVGEKEEILPLKNKLEEIKKAGDRVTEVGSEEASVGSASKRSNNFFLLGGVLAVLMAAFTIALSAQRFVRRHSKYVAILRSLGSSSFEIKSLYVLIFFELAMISIAIGIGIGWFIQEFFVTLLKDYFPTNLPKAGINPLIISALTVIICLTGFCLPYLVKLVNISPLAILRKEKSDFSFNSIFFTLVPLAAMFFLLLLYTKDLLLSSIMFFVIIGACLIGISIVFILFRKNNLIGLGAESFLKLAWQELHRRKYQNALQIIAFTIAIGLSLIAFSIKSDLILSWEESLPDDSPNNFAINITELELEPIASFLKNNGIKINPFYPIASARLIKDKNKEGLESHSVPIDRTFNITWTTILPDTNEIVEGVWFDDTKTTGLSVSEEIAQRYSLKVGDIIHLKTAGKVKRTFIQNVRKVNWESFTPNFFLIGHPSLLANTPSTYITAFYVPKSKESIVSNFMLEFRTVSLLSIDALLKQVSDIIEQVSKALQVILALTVIAACLLTIATIQDSFKMRLHQSGILRTLGAETSLLQKSTIIEFACIGTISGILASSLAQACLYFLESRIFEVSPAFHYSIWLLGPASGLIIITLLSFFLITSITSKTPREILLKS